MADIQPPIAPISSPSMVDSGAGGLPKKSGLTAYAASPNADVAAAYTSYFDSSESNSGYSRAEERALRWKLDRRLIPILWFNIIIGATDKVSTSTGALYGMREDTGSTGNKYSWLGSAFYFGYLFWCFPAAGLLQKLPMAKFMCGTIFLWGIILISTAYVHNFPTMVALRVILGILEAPIIPGGYLMLSMWYTRNEQALRSGLMYTNLSVILSGPIGYGIGAISGDGKWRWYFIILGSISLVYSVVLGIFLPDNLPRAKFLNEREKAITVERLRGDQTGIENKMFKREQMIEAFTDPKTWLMFAFNIFCSIPNGGLSNFQSLIIKGLGFSSRRALLLSMPEGGVATASAYLCNGGVWYLTRRYPKLHCRVGIIIAGEVVGMVASVFLYTLPFENTHGRLAALWMAKFFLGPYIVMLALNVANIAGHTKKVTVQAIVFIAYCVSNIIAPQFFRADQAPLYPLGMGSILGSYVLSIITIALYGLYCWWENCRRDRVDDTRGERVHEDTDFKDLTDRENVHFRYVW
ncbi:Uu.00g142770.m01.CDS01 [Anthostomella pinea]|uniref:Uu.00g142770.m01.CDS01 n=1 Tax=Anthostomella pinea TaxID=933095 RepID=A0AAI8VQI0_9PEZI|nr:Uu.00g142770.m01.CDS01 [Anthostomella pinea]